MRQPENSPEVVILTHRRDLTADVVIAELYRRNTRFFRFDPGDLPTQAAMEATIDRETGRWDQRLSADGRTVDLGSVRSIWYRRPSEFAHPPGLTRLEQKYVTRESMVGLGGVFRSMPVLWVNHPDWNVGANYKPHQLAVAARLGLHIPRTLITNSGAAAIEFYHSVGGECVYKSMSGSPYNDDTYSAIYTTGVSLEDLRDMEGISTSPCLFQEKIDKRIDIRVIVIGGEVFPVSIVGETLDWRRTDLTRIKYQRFNLGPEVTKTVLELTSAFRLNFAAIDFVISADGELVFLEVNSNGEWFWMEERTGLPMTSCLVDLLTQAEAPATASA